MAGWCMPEWVEVHAPCVFVDGQGEHAQKIYVQGTIHCLHAPTSRQRHGKGAEVRT